MPKRDERPGPAAIGWYEKAVEEGSGIAMYNMGWCYENGYRVEKDEAKALELYEKALEAGYEDAAEAVERLKGE